MNSGVDIVYIDCRAMSEDAVRASGASCCEQFE